MLMRMGDGRTMTARELARMCGGIIYGYSDAEFGSVCTDSREVENSLFIAIKGARTDGHLYIDKVFKAGSPCVLCEHIPEGCKIPEGASAVVVENTERAIAQNGHALAQRFSGKKIAVTGSVGKTTTKELIAEVLGAHPKTFKTHGNYNSLIGMPISLFGLSDDFECAVVEMGMSDRGEIRSLSKAYMPDIAVITKIGTSHLASLGTRENIRDAKFEITDGIADGGLLILNGDDKYMEGHKSDRYRVRYVSLCDEKAWLYADNIRTVGYSTLFDIRGKHLCIKDVKISAIGNHYVYNALFAAAVGMECGRSEQDIRNGFANYKSEGLRQNIYNIGGVTVIEDCYNAAPESVDAALDVLCGMRCKGRKIALLGDMLELGVDENKMHRVTGNHAAQKGTDMLFAYGELSVNTAIGAMESGLSSDMIHINQDKNDFETTARALCNTLKDGDVLLVKASRGMQAEKILEYIKENCKG